MLEQPTCSRGTTLRVGSPSLPQAPNAAGSSDPATNQDQFGFSVAIDGDTIVVGAYNESSDTTEIIHGDDLSTTNDTGQDNGAVYVFRRTGVTWRTKPISRLPMAWTFSGFGKEVAIDGDTIVVGVPSEASSTTEIIHGDDLSATNGSGISNGAVYVFVRNGTTWSHQAYLKAPNGAPLRSIWLIGGNR